MEDEVAHLSPTTPAEGEEGADLSVWSADVLLSDGSTAHVRPIRPADGAALVSFHDQLSSETIYRRFFSAHPHLSEREVQRFTHVDYSDRMALVATVAQGEIVAVARY